MGYKQGVAQGEADRLVTWASGEAYERYIGRWSRLVASAFVDWLGTGPHRRWLDVGCGTGALTETILTHCDPVEVVAVDPSAAQVSLARKQIDDDRACFVVADADHLPDVAVDVAVSGLVLNFVPDPATAVAAMRDRAPGGIVAAYLWDYAEGMEMLRHFWDVAVALDPSVAPLDEAARSPICRPDRLEAVWRDTGLVDVDVRPIDVPTHFRDFDDFWTPFLGGQGPAPGYVMALDERGRSALADGLRAALPVRPDGTIPLRARAWAVRGRSATSSSGASSPPGA